MPRAGKRDLTPLLSLIGQFCPALFAKVGRRKSVCSIEGRPTGTNPSGSILQPANYRDGEHHHPKGFRHHGDGKDAKHHSVSRDNPGTPLPLDVNGGVLKEKIMGDRKPPPMTATNTANVSFCDMVSPFVFGKNPFHISRRRIAHKLVSEKASVNEMRCEMVALQEVGGRAQRRGADGCLLELRLSRSDAFASKESARYVREARRLGYRSDRILGHGDTSP
jgi:hypothetical protein